MSACKPSALNCSQLRLPGTVQLLTVDGDRELAVCLVLLMACGMAPVSNDACLRPRTEQLSGWKLYRLPPMALPGPFKDLPQMP
mmetsp:Transcript_24445/g.36790  ORF Transcript_24445/g.36790 Transcript_24445/m.36790 type:complete len:84 (+) Transcript_24445:61-312(+)